ncbi:MAG: ABC transporter substrate-binding protein [Bacteroidetes bacterium]|nr:ABC transporter substrate-binding protein [Bacteroidota bacterium]
MGISTHHLLRSLVVTAFIGICLTSTSLARFQTAIPKYEVADSLLSAGLASFANGQYEVAEATMDRVLNEFQLNQATTTAILFAAKSAYRLGNYERTRSYLSGFAGTYGTSSYVDEARQLDRLSFDAIKYASSKGPGLGVIFSLGQEESKQSQEIFNGVRVAVDQFNEDPARRPIQMTFRDINGGAAAARRAVRELASEGVSIIIGTLFSEEALAAAEEAERLKVLFVAPLATDDNLVANRTHTFQANPSMNVRGSAMARFVANGLGLDSIAVILASDDRKISKRQADGFLEEASRLGLVVNMMSVLDRESDLRKLDEILAPDTLKNSQAVYIPLASRNPVATVGAILSNLDRLNPNIRVIGNEGWQDLPQKSHASAYLVTYGNEFWIDPQSSEYRSFTIAFKAIARAEPGRLGVTGFDVTNFVLSILGELEGITSSEDPEMLDESNTTDQLIEAFKIHPAFQGLGLRIHFDGSYVNQALFYHRYSDGALTLIR